MGSWNPWDDPAYYWVVICKNKRFHNQTNTLFGHKIPLGEADAVSSMPAIRKPFLVLCDERGKEHSYNPKEVLRLEFRHPEFFTPHPLFSERTNGQPLSGQVNEPEEDGPIFRQLLSRITLRPGTRW